MHAHCGSAPVAHGEDYSGAAAHDVASGIEVGERGLHGVVVYHDGVATADFKSAD